MGNNTETGSNIGEYFEWKPANHWLRMSGKIEKCPLFGEFWTQGEIAVVFGQIGTGKSILAVQLADFLSRAYTIEPFQNFVAEHKVLYLDLDRNAKQFVRRYTPEIDPETYEPTDEEPYGFGENLIRVEAGYSHRMQAEHIAELLEVTKAKTLVIDNLAYFMKYNIPREAAAIMRDIRRLRDAYNLSVLVTMNAKRSNVRRPISVFDMPCSEAISSAADTVFAIGRSGSRSNGRYIKHLKTGVRDTAFESDQVPYFEVINCRGTFPEFQFAAYVSEKAALANDRGVWEYQKLLEIEAYRAEGKTIRQIAGHLGMSSSAVHRRLQIAEETIR